jgi:AraC-like DNA-binding protein
LRDFFMHHASLRSFRVLDTCDADAARSVLIDTYGARTFNVRPRDRFKVKASFVQVGGISLSYCDYASSVTLSFPEARFIRQHLCLSGNAGIASGGRIQDLSQDNWSGIVPPGMRVDYSYSANTRQLVMWLDVDKLGRKLNALIGNSRATPPQWPGDGYVQRVALDSMKRAVEFVVTELDTAGQVPFTQSGSVEIEDFIMVRFLYAHGHDQMLRLSEEVRFASHAQLRRLEDYIFENWRAPLDVETMADVSGVSARSVFRYFKSAHGCTPQAFRKRIRLEQARNQLRRSEPGTTVISVALSCGFQSLGHFARDYRDHFGELPSKTLANGARM